MTRGRKPDPAAIKRAKGNPGRRPIHEAPAGGEVAGLDRIEPPAWLDTSAQGTVQSRHISKLALETWRRALPMAQQLNLLRQTDFAAFGRWCRYFAEWVWYTAKIDREGATYETTSPHVERMVRLHPATRLRREAEQALKDLEDRLGFTPAARLRLFQALAAQQPSLPGLERVDEDAPGGSAPAGGAVADLARQSPIGFLGGGKLN